MGFREVTMLEIRELLRRYLLGEPKKRIATSVGCDPKTVRRYIAEAAKRGLCVGQDSNVITDELIAAVSAAVRPAPERDFGESWLRCVEQQAFIAKKLAERVRLSKVRRLLARQGVLVPYTTLHRFAADVLGFGRAAVTLPVLDGEPGKELQVDTGWVLTLAPDVKGRRRRLRAFIFTPHLSRYRFVYPIERETTVSAIEACEAAWEFYGGVFHVLVPDNTKAIVEIPDPLSPKLIRAFVEYSQSRGFVIDTARVRHAKDKARVERSVRDVRDDCFGGESLSTLAQGREHAERWCRSEYGMRKHTTTQRLPREHFDHEEKLRLLAAPSDPYDVPHWCEPKVGRDHFAAVAKSLYTLPTQFIGKRLIARADKSLVRFYDHAVLVKTHPRVEPGKRSIDPSDFPPERTPYAMRDVAFLTRTAYEHGPAVGRFAEALFKSPLPWTRMRAVRMLFGLARKFGDQRLNATCDLALAADMTDVHRLERMLKRAAEPTTAPAPTARVIPIGRYLRPPQQYSLALASRPRVPQQGDE